MNTETGDLYYYTDGTDAAEPIEIRNTAKHLIKPIDPINLSAHRRAALLKYGHTQIGPRERCPCGSGRRFKNCCMTR